MRRVSGIAATFLVAVAMVTWTAARRLGAGAVAVGRDLYSHRDILRAHVVRRFPDRPLVVWLGDSTIVTMGRPSYPELIGALVGRSEPVESRVVALPGLDFFHFYFLLGPVLDLRPDVVVLLAHLRMFNLPAGRTFNDLASLLPARELLATTRLPLQQHGLTLPGLLLARCLRAPAGEEALYFFEGARALFQEAGFWDGLGPNGVTPLAALRNLVRVQSQTLAGYDVALSPRQPTVRMMGAAVAMAVRGGARTVVVASPVPYDVLARRGWYDADVYRERIGVLGATVERSGGTLIDLHDALARAEFADQSGHYNEEGTAHLAALLAPVIRDALHDGAGHPTAARPAVAAAGRTP